MAKNFEQAFALWPLWKSQYKMYNANIMTNNFLRNNDHVAAISFLQHVATAIPSSVRAIDRLANLYQQDQQAELARTYRLKVQQLLNETFDKPISEKQEDSLSRYSYNLLDEDRNQEAIAVLKRITKVKPNSISAHDNLADAYELVKNYPAAIKTLQKTITMAEGKKDVSTASFQQRLSRLKSINNAG